MDKILKESIDNIHQQILTHCKNIIGAMVSVNRMNDDVARELIKTAIHLDTLTPTASKPKWLNELLEFRTKELRAGYTNSSASELVTFLLVNFHSISLPILTPDEVNYDFDKAFEAIRDEEDIPAAFDRLIELLQQIIVADLIDSRVIQESLDRLQALLNRNKYGSLASILVSLNYGRFALKAFEGILSANKYLKPIVDSLKEEFSDAEEKTKKAQEKLQQFAVQKLTNKQRLLATLQQHGIDQSQIAGYLGNSTENQGA